MERFLEVEASSGIALLVAAAVALVWANSQWRQSYAAIWHLPLGLRLGPLAFERDLHFWVNDGLMTVFFFVVGLEIRRELQHGELSEPKRAAFPFAAAVGGMLALAVVFFVLNRGYESVRGWGIGQSTHRRTAGAARHRAGIRPPVAPGAGKPTRAGEIVDLRGARPSQ